MTRQRRRRESRQRTKSYDAGVLLANHMHREGLAHVEFTMADLQAGPRNKRLRITVDGSSVPAPALLGLHMERLKLTDIEFNSAALADPAPGHAVVYDGDSDILRVSLLPEQVAEAVAGMPGFTTKRQGQQHE